MPLSAANISLNLDELPRSKFVRLDLESSNSKRLQSIEALNVRWQMQPDPTPDLGDSALGLLSTRLGLAASKQIDSEIKWICEFAANRSVCASLAKKHQVTREALGM